MGKTRTGTSAASVTFDAGALIALERGDRRLVALLAEIARRGGHIRVPSGVVAQAWRDGRRQATLARFLRTDAVQIVSLDAPLSRSCGELCGATGTADVIDASVVIVAREHGDVILTSDPEDLRRLSPKAQLMAI
jgi:hypothetical protein